jgi:hypothetical protein
LASGRSFPKNTPTLSVYKFKQKKTHSLKKKLPVVVSKHNKQVKKKRKTAFFQQFQYLGKNLFTIDFHFHVYDTT